MVRRDGEEWGRQRLRGWSSGWALPAIRRTGSPPDTALPRTRRAASLAEHLCKDKHTNDRTPSLQPQQITDIKKFLEIARRSDAKCESSGCARQQGSGTGGMVGLAWHGTGMGIMRQAPGRATWL